MPAITDSQATAYYCYVILSHFITMSLDRKTVKNVNVGNRYYRRISLFGFVRDQPWLARIRDTSGKLFKW